MAVVKGLDIVLAIENAVPGTFTTLGGQRGATLNRSSDTIDVTNKVNGGWKESISGFKAWSVDCDGIFVTDDAAYALLETAFNAGNAIEVQLSGGDLSYTGEAIITDFPVEAPYDDAVTYSISLTGTGALVVA